MVNELFSLPETPTIAGLHFRYTRGAEDAEALHALQYAAVAHDSAGDPVALADVPTCEQMAGWLAETMKTGKANRRLIAQINDSVVGCCEVMAWKEAVSEDDVTWVYLNIGYVLPDWRGKGLATAMLHWAENTSRRLAASEHPGVKMEYAANAEKFEKEATALLLHEGYHVAFTRLEMDLDPAIPLPPKSPVPAGLEVRPVLPDHIPLINASIEEAFQNEYAAVRYYDPERHLAELYDPKNDLGLWFVAWEKDSASESGVIANGAGMIAGQVMSIIENGRAEVFQVSVRPPWRRRGLARCLLLRALHDLRKRGFNDIWLCTIAEYPTCAKDLYTSVGFCVTKEVPRYRKAFDQYHNIPGG